MSANDNTPCLPSGDSDEVHDPHGRPSTGPHGTGFAYDQSAPRFRGNDAIGCRTNMTYDTGLRPVGAEFTYGQSTPRPDAHDAIGCHANMTYDTGSRERADEPLIVRVQDPERGGQPAD